MNRRFIKRLTDALLWVGLVVLIGLGVALIV